MSSQAGAILDVRPLGQSRESVAYPAGGLFPVLALAPGGAIVGIVRGGAGHLGLAGPVEVIRLLDGGAAWTPPAVIADREWDDRDYACGVSPAGTLILAYHRSGCYDADGTYRPERYREVGPPQSEVRVTRSHDGGLTWSAPRPLTATGRGVTAYYSPSISPTGDWRSGDFAAFYDHRDYRAVAITWDEEELIAAVAGWG